MIIKFLPNKGKGTCLATMNYLLGRKGDRELAQVLQGDPQLTQQLADSLEFKHKYTVGVLSFQENDLDDKTKREIMADFEKSLLCGLEADQYNICWIEHKDKGRLELNFVIPKVELSTGKALNPYFDSVDRKRVNAFKDHTNAKYDLSDPNDPEKRQPLTPKYNLPKDKKALQEAITGFLMNEIGQGRVTDRQGVLNAIQSDLGLSVARITPNSISISYPTNEKGRNIRLKGEIYADTFRFKQDHSAENQRESREYRANRSSRILEARTILTAEIERKRAFNIELYNRPRKEPTGEAKHRPSVQELASDSDRGASNPNIGASRGQSMAIQQITSHNGRNGNDRTEHQTDPSTSQSPNKSSDWTEQRRFNLDTAQKPTKNRHWQKQRRQAPNHLEITSHAKRLFERLQHIAELARTAVKRITNDQHQAERADRAVTDGKSRLDSTERAITSHFGALNGRKREILICLTENEQREQQAKQREQQVNRLIAEPQKPLNRGKNWDFGR